MNSVRSLLAIALGLSVSSVFADEDPLIARTIQNYAPIAIREYTELAIDVYADSVDQSYRLLSAAGKFAKAPSEEGLEIARQAWLEARKPFLQTLALQIPGGPLDADAIRELDGGAVDEEAIDNAQAAGADSIVDRPDLYPQITPDLLASLARKKGNGKVCTGYHAIEFLLWGKNGAFAKRPASDFVDGAEATAPNGVRRAQYLVSAALLLVNELRAAATEWSPKKQDNYRTRFLALPQAEAMAKIVTGMIQAGLGESKEAGVEPALTSRNAKLEPSRYSDNAINDLRYRAKGIANVCLGGYVRADGRSGASGPGLYAVALQAAGSHALHPNVGAAGLKMALEKMLVATDKLPPSLRQTVEDESAATDREQVKRTIQLEKELIGEAAAVAKYGLHLELPESLGNLATPVADDIVKREIIVHYADIAHAVYEDSLLSAREMRTALQCLVDSPSEASLAAARQAWLAARNPYSQSEVFRFYSGPIDGENGPEALLNSWPIDEAYVDYVKDQPDVGIINDAAHFPSITTDLLVSLNQKEGETNVSTGYHALEFLLWGQNFHDEGPGNRPSTDYVVEASGKSNVRRRRQYLLATADLLVRDLENVTKEWAADHTDNYRAKFLALPPDAAIKNMLTGMAVLAGVELSGERMLVALDTKIAKEEQSCFSDNTHNDIIENARGIANLFYGSYRRLDGKTIRGPGVYDLAQKIWGAEPGILKIDMDQVMDDVKKIPPPFGRAILGEDSAPGRQQVNATVNSLTTLAGDLAQFGQRQGMHINITSAKDGDE